MRLAAEPIDEAGSVRAAPGSSLTVVTGGFSVRQGEGRGKARLRLPRGGCCAVQVGGFCRVGGNFLTEPDGDVVVGVISP